MSSVWNTTKAKTMARKKRVTRRTNYKRKPTLKKLDTKIKKIQRHQELKHHDIHKAYDRIDVPADLVLLNAPVLGTGDDDRVGDRITMTSLQLKLEMAPQNDRDISSFVRVIIFMDKQANNEFPPVLEFDNEKGAILDGIKLGSGRDGLTYQMPYNRESVPSRYKIFYDKIILLNPGTMSGWTNLVSPSTDFEVTSYTRNFTFLNEKIPLGSREVVFGGNTEEGGVPQDINKNSLYLMICGDSVAPESNHNADYGFTSRLYFKDD